MDGKQYLGCQLAIARRLGDGVIGDLTNEQLSWQPTGTANPIGATLVHAFGTEDLLIQSILQEKPKLWDSEDWSDRVGVTAMPRQGADWEEASSKQLDVETLLAYGKAVRAATDCYLASLTCSDLDRTLMVFGRERSVADVLSLLVVHTTHHIGEIAAHKGAQGAKGLAF
jgi:uncharacterized damage-inducible protein DinB